MATTGVCDTWKAEVMSGFHAMLPTLSGLTTVATSTTSVTGMSSTAGIVQGMAVTGTNVPANCYVAAVTGASTLTLSLATTGAATSMTFTADSLLMLLIKVAPARTFDHTQTNVGTPGTGTPSTSNVGTDETSGTGYTSGGAAAVTTAAYPQVNTAVGITTFSNISWTSATFSATAGVLYNNTGTRTGAAATPLAGRTIAVYDFGGTQTVSSGTLTLVMPTANSTNAILRIA